MTVPSVPSVPSPRYFPFFSYDPINGYQEVSISPNIDLNAPNQAQPTDEEGERGLDNSTSRTDRQMEPLQTPRADPTPTPTSVE